MMRRRTWGRVLPVSGKDPVRLTKFERERLARRKAEKDDQAIDRLRRDLEVLADCLEVEGDDES